MKCYIIDTLVGVFSVDESGNLLGFIDFNGDDHEIIEFYEGLDSDILKEGYEKFLLDLQNSGFDEYVFDNKKLQSLTSQELGYDTSLKEESLECKNFRMNLKDQLKKVGISFTEEEISRKYKKINEELIKNKISQASQQTDLIIIQIIETLDVIKKSISLFSNRLREWYGLHFPELTDKIIEDNIKLAEIVVKLGNRSRFTAENIEKQFEFNKQLIAYLLNKAKNSMGADIDLTVLQDYAKQIISLDVYRINLENHLDKLMERFAPNINAIVGSLIGAKLIAKAGSLKKLAYMPASRIQLIGAEKALYRFLKTGEKRPKHGIIFQWRQIRGSAYYHRGKIARLIAGKIGIASKLDHFGGEYMGDILTKEINEKIKEIELKHSMPSKKKGPEKTKYKKKRKKKK
ncbi:MAG: hypothetical protein EU539_14040, partial [Promethearchaeota archaeon]